VTFSPYRSGISLQLSWLTDVSPTDFKCCESLCVCVCACVCVCVCVCARARAERLMSGSDNTFYFSLGKLRWTDLRTWGWVVGCARLKVMRRTFPEYGQSFTSCLTFWNRNLAFKF
jgi:hypothetical protein